MHAPRHRYSFAEYLTLDEDANVKLELAGGEIYAMAGGSREHAALGMALGIMLGTQLGGRPCAAHSSDLRIRIRATGLSTYPDVTVVCGPAELDPEDAKGHTVTNPIVLCEVLGPSTEEFDRGEKLHDYKLIPSARHVVLVAFDRRRVEVWSRGEGSAWFVASAGAAERIALPAVGAELDVDELYRDPLTGGFLAPAEP